MDNYRILGKSVEIKVSSKMVGYKMNLPFNADLPNLLETKERICAIIILYGLGKV